MKLLDEAGWAVGDDGIRRNAQGETLKIEFLTSRPTIDRIVQPYVDNLKAMGIDAQYNRVDDAQFTLRRRERDFDMILAGLSGLAAALDRIVPAFRDRGGPPIRCSTPLACMGRISSR